MTRPAPVHPLIGRLLREHVSLPQLLGFVFANLFGMLIVVLAWQFYSDVMPVFSGEDNFLHANYLVINKRIGTGNTLSGRTQTFTADDIDELEAQPFTDEVGKFTSTDYEVNATMGINGQRLLSSELYFESVPDRYIDIDTRAWTYRPDADSVPIILPRVYINMYNFGFASNRLLPKISEGVLSMIDVGIRVSGEGGQREFIGKVVGFSKRLNTILVPQAFMDWSNATYGSDSRQQPTRLILKVKNPADERIAQYLDDNALENETDDLEAGKTTYFLKLILFLVIGVGLLIAVMSFYMLLLSIYLLVQKNADKLHNLLLIGYSPATVARTYQTLAVALNAAVLVVALAVVALLRPKYMHIIETLFPNVDDGSLWPALLIGVVIFLIVCLLNVVIIRRKINKVWQGERTIPPKAPKPPSIPRGGSRRWGSLPSGRLGGGILLLLLSAVWPAVVQSQSRWNQAYQNYIDEFKDVAIEQMLRYRIPASITLAQGILESGAGRSDLARKGNNHFGIKCHGWQGRTTYHDDDEEGECFRAYDSAMESYEDHSKFLAGGQRYRSLFSLPITDYKGWARGLKAAGYATSPTYAQALINLIETYRLYQYDTATTYQRKSPHQTSPRGGFSGSDFPPGGTRGATHHPIQRTNRNYYIIARQGDTFKSLAEEVGISARKLARYNERRKRDTLHEGDIVFLKKKRARADKSFRRKPHVVQPGESMYDIAQHYGIRLKSLYKKNGLDPRTYTLRPGDTLKVY